MALSDTYVEAKKKAAENPWYTKWVWWVLAASLGVLVFALWSMAKKQEAKAAAAHIVAEEKVVAAKLAVRAEQDRAKAVELTAVAREAQAEEAMLRADMLKTADERKKLEAAIKGAKSWDELEKLEKEVG